VEKTSYLKLVGVQNKSEPRYSPVVVFLIQYFFSHNKYFYERFPVDMLDVYELWQSLPFGIFGHCIAVLPALKPSV
jgi:hypothetical protein